jgi:uncharacterized protein
MAATISDPPLASVLAFCADDPVERVFLEDVARRGLGRFEAVEENGRLTALCHVGANVVPSGAGCSVFARAAARGNPRMIIGDERAVDELWDVARHRMARPRADRPGQPVYVIEEPPDPGDTELRAATVGDLELLVPACARTHLEEIGVNPLRRDAEGFRWRTRAQIEEGRSWLWEKGGTILFKAEASAWTPGAIQIQQVWVDPEVRGRKYAQRGMCDLVRLLLERVPRVCLFVRAENAAAIRVYEAIGMTHTNTYRSLLF